MACRAFSMVSNSCLAFSLALLFMAYLIWGAPIRVSKLCLMICDTEESMFSKFSIYLH